MNKKDTCFRNILNKVLYENSIDPKTYLRYNNMIFEAVDENKELLRKVLHDYVNTLSEDELRNMIVSNDIQEDVSTERNQRILASEYVTQIKIICSNPRNIYLDAKNEYRADSHFFPLQLRFDLEKINKVTAKKTYAEVKNIGYQLYIVNLNCITNIKDFPEKVQLLPITSGEWDNVIFHELIHVLDFDDEVKNNRIPIPFVGYNGNYFNEPHEYHAISQTILNKLDNLTPDDKVELQKYQVIEPRELGLNTWIDKFVKHILDKSIPQEQRPFYDDFMRSLNEVHLKDFIDKIIDLLVDNKWIEVIDLQKNTLFLNYPQD